MKKVIVIILVALATMSCNVENVEPVIKPVKKESIYKKFEKLDAFNFNGHYQDVVRYNGTNYVVHIWVNGNDVAVRLMDRNIFKSIKGFIKVKGTHITFSIANMKFDGYYVIDNKRVQEGYSGSSVPKYDLIRISGDFSKFYNSDKPVRLNTDVYDFRTKILFE